LNLSKSGLSASFGGAPLTLNVGPRGVYGTASLPGTGISFRHRLAGNSDRPDSDALSPAPLPTPTALLESFPVPPFRPPFQLSPPTNAVAVEEIRSASTELLTSQSLKELKALILTTHQEHEEISSDLDEASRETRDAYDRWFSWEDGFLLKRLFKKKFASRKAALKEAEAKVAELEEQLRMTKIAAQIDIDKEQAEPYFRMRDSFAGLSECAAIWDIRSHQAADNFRERTNIDLRINRERVRFSLSDCALIEWEQPVPHLANAKGGELFLYPGFILYRAAREAFSVIDYHDVHATTAIARFQEEQAVPTDSQIAGQAWAKANKNGSPDRRFANNYQIPIALYGVLTLKSETGLWEEFHCSNPDRLKRFLNSWTEFRQSFLGDKHIKAPLQ
jgi:hypothetical protein